MLELIVGTVVVRSEEVKKSLESIPVQGKKLLEPLKSIATQHDLPFNILEDKDVSDNLAEVHAVDGDLWLCLEGEAVFTLGGELVDPYEVKRRDGVSDSRELKAKKIQGGTNTVLKSGDYLWIPPGVPHVHNVPTGVARLVIIKIPKV
ncbi:MAG: hypothetical protein A3I89_01990 [Candidatus Harrisonbacteria bacterium RIFCSPLOWO2_02_FULL_41_11]|uniref:Cupin type-1 domain-containing protein n=1 Tax=Candidatus Harrisonbacteria bacterium RIFCSPHIGHO2_02_FULL_42_16 TaxID=1798404 RepID=A0A1G1ZG67_9BACT|nr:MAG: hypothetical protein A3B92_01780 [Candidatus Harrisonbacteria bacterium RIFCSPHIGHO2_02_FULL_42_16]OGY65631.1 MAG: hypothetical protein A3I89_01990 [Candidatus Harrisonbacteria bacterium RIFCSPLOWO2_02_FULL_41_11]